ncbi:MAG: alpha/beta hydrolase domain-containing protein [Myxococcales bacterium]
MSKWAPDSREADRRFSDEQLTKVAPADARETFEWMHLSPRAVAFLLFLCPAATFASPPRAGFIDSLQIVNTYDAYGGQSFGDVGPYEVVVAIAHGKLDPTHPANAGIVDLALATRDANGLVGYRTDVVILRPKSAAHAKRVLFYDVVNRGNKLALGTFNGGAGSLTPGSSAGNALLLRMGYTIVWSGWQGNLPVTGAGDSKPLGTDFPVATNPDGSAITGQTREEFILDSLDASNGRSLTTLGPATLTLTYPAATLDKSSVTFNWRSTWKTADGMRFDGPANPVPDANWSYVNGGAQVQLTPPTGADLGSIFTFVYTATNPKPMAIGFASVRDLITFLNHDKSAANPVADIAATCRHGDCDDDDANFSVTILEGISQSGRFTRDFLWQGFNDDARGRHAGGREHTVFNGMFPIIPASRKTYTNYRWSQPFRWSKEHEDHFQPGDQFPFAYNVIRDPVSGRVDGILRRCRESETCPKIVQLDGGFEYFGGRGTLVSTDGRGHDLKLPENVRIYVVPGTNHGGGAGLDRPSSPTTCRNTTSVVVESTIDRALVPVLEDWVANNTPPPPSAYPSNAAGTLAPAEDAAAVGFPDLSSLGSSYTWSGNLINELYVTSYSGGVPEVDLSKEYKVMVSKTDADGNERAGVRVPEIVVPLGTFTSWNSRAAGHTPGESCGSNGSSIWFAKTEADRAAAGDPRPSLEARYSSKAGYVSKVQAAAEALVQQRLLLEEDVQSYVNAAQNQTVLQ